MELDYSLKKNGLSTANRDVPIKANTYNLPIPVSVIGAQVAGSYHLLEYATSDLGNIKPMMD